MGAKRPDGGSARTDPTAIKTMEEFSSYVGLSRPTVSKYFNDPASVRASTRTRIEAAARASGFRPNIFAANLKRKHSRFLGIIVPSSTDPFYMDLVRRVEQIAREAGYTAFMLSSDGDARLEAEAIERMQAMNVAGAVVVPLGSGKPNARYNAFERGRRIVYADAALDCDGPFVGTDNAQSIGLLVRYLCRTGLPPAFLRMPAINRNAHERLSAYESAMAHAGETPHVLDVPETTGWDFEAFGHTAMARAMASRRRPKAILCANDRVALGALSAAWESGLALGRDPDAPRIAGHDDHPFSKYACPPLTTVAQNIDAIATQAMSFLLNETAASEHAAGTAQRVLFPGNLMLRDSA